MPDHGLGAQLRVISTGVDTLVFTAPLMPDGKLHAWLDDRQKAAQAIDDELVVEVAGHPFRVAKGGADRGFYRYGLLSEEVGNIWFSVEKDRGVKCELGSFALWTTQGRGEASAAVEAYRQLRRCLCDLFKCRDGFPARATRIDFCIDFQGWRPTKAEGLSAVSRSTMLRGDQRAERKCEACRARHPASSTFCSACGHRLGTPRPDDGGYVDPFELEPPEDYYTKRELTGLRWGSGKPLMLRVYDKTVEIRDNSPDKVWFPEVWRVAGGDRYVEGEPVMRCEVEAKRQFLKSLRIDGQKLETVDEFIENAATVVRYLIGYDRRVCDGCGDEPAQQRNRFCRKCSAPLRRPKGWLELRVPVGDRPDRWPVHPAWAALQRAPFAFSTPPATRARRVRDGASREVCRAMTDGTASTWAVLTGVPEQLRAELGRRPTEAELRARTFERMAQDSAPGAFENAVERKQLARRVNPAAPQRLEREAEQPLQLGGPSPFQRKWQRAVKSGYREERAQRLLLEKLDRARAAREAAEKSWPAGEGITRPYVDPSGRRWQGGRLIEEAPG